MGSKLDVAAIDKYRAIYAAAIRNTVKLGGLTGDIDQDGAILVNRINTKRRKLGYNTDWKGDLWDYEEEAI